MKKILFLSVLALGLMTSCSNDDYLSSSTLEPNSIAFSTQQGGSTRSGSTITSLTNFTVDAVACEGEQYFIGIDFAYNSTLGVFQSGIGFVG